MRAYLLKGKLKYTPEDLGEPFFIYDMGTYHIAIESGSVAENIVSRMEEKYIHGDEIGKDIPQATLNDVLYKLEGSGLILSQNGTRESSIIYGMLKKLSFGPGGKCESDIYDYIKTFWKEDGLYQDSYIRLEDITKAFNRPASEIRNDLFQLIKKGNIICYDTSPRYPKSRYKQISDMPFVVYTENKKDIDIKKLFIKEVNDVS